VYAHALLANNAGKFEISSYVIVRTCVCVVCHLVDNAASRFEIRDRVFNVIFLIKRRTLPAACVCGQTQQLHHSILLCVYNTFGTFASCMCSCGLMCGCVKICSPRERERARAHEQEREEMYFKHMLTNNITHYMRTSHTRHAASLVMKTVSRRGTVCCNERCRGTPKIHPSMNR